MMIDFFGTTPGLLSLAGAALILILVSVLRRLAARARARRAGVEPAAAGRAEDAAAPEPAAAPGPGSLPRWVVAAIAAWAAEEAGGGLAADFQAPSAAAWGLPAPASPGCAPTPPSFPAPCGADPWLAAAGPARRNVGVTK